ncbi:MAG: tripartite tricarboxylate transporter TctB family protein [Burkholderiaceae bacterium]
MKPAGNSSWRPLAAPLAFLAAAGVLTRFITDRPEEAAAMARGIAGPTTWPTVMLYATMLFAFGWVVQRTIEVLRRRENGVGAAVAAPVGAGGVRVWLGIALVLAYGFSLPVLGFALATLLYIVLWLWLGGVRSPLQLGLLSVLGTTTFLYLFIKLALMPLDRGAGWIGESTIVLYRWLHIF